MRRRTILLVVGGGLLALLVGGGALLLVDAGEDPRYADVERNPVPPERPDSLTTDTVSAYASAYEEQRLYNDVLAAHSHRLRWNDSVVTVCRVQSVTETGGAFRVELQCAGGIDNREYPERDEVFEYRVTYRINETATEQVAIEGFPYEERDKLSDRPPERDGT